MGVRATVMAISLQCPRRHPCLDPVRPKAAPYWGSARARIVHVRIVDLSGLTSRDSPRSRRCDPCLCQRQWKGEVGVVSGEKLEAVQALSCCGEKRRQGFRVKSSMRVLSNRYLGIEENRPVFLTNSHSIIEECETVVIGRRG